MTNASHERAEAGLPERWKRNRQRAALLCLLLTTAFAGLLCHDAGPEGADTWWYRARFSLREALLGSRPNAQIVLVALDDRSLNQWPEPLIGWGSHLADAVAELNRSGARVVALDWIQPIETDAYLHQHNDEKLGQALAETPHLVMIKLVKPGGGYVLMTPSLRLAPPKAWRDGGQSLTGFADLSSLDSEDVAFLPQIPGDANEVAFAQRIAQSAGASSHPLGPLRPDGSMLINYASGTGLGRAFARYSLAEVASEKAPDSRFAGKIVLIGSTYKGNNDGHFVPLFRSGLSGSRLVDGMEVQANAVATLLKNNPITEPGAGLNWLFAALLGALGVGAYTWCGWRRAPLLTLAVALAWGAVSLLLFCAAHYALPLAVPVAALVVGAGAMGGYRALGEERERAQVMRIWGRHQDPRLIAELLAHPEWQGGQGAEATVTVLFADLKNFTKTVESLAPTAAILALNRYLSLLSEVILQQGGVVDKYLGDGLMAQWGAPLPRADHADAAVRACLEIERRLRELTPRLQAAGDVSFEVRLTLHTGPVVAGPLGSHERLEYTIIGDTVNVTSRLQETAKELGCDFLISQTTHNLVTLPLVLGQETQVNIRGRQQPLRVFEVVTAPTAATVPASAGG